MTMRQTMDDIDEDELRSLKAGGMPQAYGDDRAPEMPLPDDGEMTLPEMDFSGSSPLGAPDDSSADLKYLSNQPTGGPTPKPVNAPAPAAKPDDEYLTALRRIKETLARPGPNLSAGLADAQAKDASENRTNRILDYLSAGLRRAPTAQLSPLATNASGFLQKAGLERQQSDGELARLGQVARLARPIASAKGTAKDPGNVESLRAYLVKVGAGSAEELADMNEKQLGAVMQAYGLQDRMKTHANERGEDLEWRKTVHADAQDNASATRALAARGIDEKNKDDVSNDAKVLAEKLGDTAVFEQRYKKLQDLIKANGGEVPGLGKIEGVRQQPGFIGSAVRAVSPPSPQAVEGRKTLRQLAADYARAISGAGVSDRERENLNAATVDVDNDDSAIAMAGLESLREMYEAKAAQLKKGFRPEAVQRVSPDAPSSAKIRVRNLETGETGSISEQFFDPAKYEKI